ncbi:MAG: aminoglycoside phosphotransferase family protein [Paenibacillaceae bacterium]
MSRGKEVDERLICSQWGSMHCAEKFKPLLNGEVILNHRQMECLKNSYKSSIWKLEIKVDQKKIPIILKVFKHLRKPRRESTVEKNIYRKAKNMLQPFMPVIYMTKKNVNGHDLWVFMEYIQKIQGQIQFLPPHFEKIIPTLARLHASTMNKSFIQHRSLFVNWLPLYDSKEMVKKRKEWNDRTVYYLDQAMKIPEYKTIVEPYSLLLNRLLKKGPEYFPEVCQAGCSIVHSDLQLSNMVCHNVGERHWNIKFIDWEGGKFAPCWYDMVSLIGVYMAYKREWSNEEEAITERCVQLYATEMEKNGVTFVTDPLKLYHMAYLQRILQRGLYLQLSWAVTGRKEAKLLKVYLDKIKVLSMALSL